MNYIKEKMRAENKKNIGIEPVIDMKHFVLLLLADLASKSPILHFDGSNTQTACLGTDYKRIIEEIMYAENGWGIKFAELIDICSYYEYQIEYEEKLARMIKQVCSELNKEYYFDIENDRIRIDFTNDEIENIKNMYDEHVLETMSHFTKLMSAPAFSRKFNMEMKELSRSRDRWESHIQDLNLRATYSNKLTIAKPLYKTLIKPEPEEDKQVIKKISK